MGDGGKITDNADGGTDAVAQSGSHIGGPNPHPSGAPNSNHISNNNQKDAPQFLGIPIDRWIELVFTFAIMAATVVNVCVAIQQWSVANGQLDVMRDDKRPWLRANVDIKELVLSDWGDDKHIFARLVFDLKNHGESPANNINMATIVGPHPSNDRGDLLDASQKLMCQQAKAAAIANPIGGPTVFPGESNKKDNGAGSNRAFPGGEPTIFSVNGCIIYRYGQRYGETGFRIIVGRIERNRVVGIPFIEGPIRPYEEPIPPELHGFPGPPKVAIIPPEDFVFRFEEAGNYAR